MTFAAGWIDQRLVPSASRPIFISVEILFHILFLFRGVAGSRLSGLGRTFLSGRAAVLVVIRRVNLATGQIRGHRNLRCYR